MGKLARKGLNKDNTTTTTPPPLLLHIPFSKTYSEPYQISEMKAINYFRKSLHLRCVTGF